ncbi:MAG TPA: chemotaxis protein CheX [Candidatus Binataceae bacterium]|nr:chemotaxis protein CheX [Candidatus Binataceae bacterium]
MRSDRLEVEEIHEATARLWEAMFEASLEYLEEECECTDSRFLTGSIQINGAWDGAIVLRASFNFARSIAQLMLGLDDAGDEEICDAMGELTNLTSGAIQTLLPEPSELTPPSVIEGCDYKLVFPGLELINSIHCRFREEPLSILIFEARSGDAKIQHEVVVDGVAPR